VILWKVSPRTDKFEGSSSGDWTPPNRSRRLRRFYFSEIERLYPYSDMGQARIDHLRLLPITARAEFENSPRRRHSAHRLLSCG